MSFDESVATALETIRRCLPNVEGRIGIFLTDEKHLAAVRAQLTPDELERCILRVHKVNRQAKPAAMTILPAPEQLKDAKPARPSLRVIPGGLSTKTPRKKKPAPPQLRSVPPDYEPEPPRAA